MTNRLIACLLVALTACSCRKEVPTEELENYRSKLHAAYFTNDLRASESVFLDDLRTVSNWESNQVVGIDFHACQALDHEGLFYIYRKAHRTNQTIAEFQLSISNINESRRGFGLPPIPIITMDEFAKEIEKRERIYDSRPDSK